MPVLKVGKYSGCSLLVAGCWFAKI